MPVRPSSRITVAPDLAANKSIGSVSTAWVGSVEWRASGAATARRPGCTNRARSCATCAASRFPRTAQLFWWLSARARFSRWWHCQPANSAQASVLPSFIVALIGTWSIGWRSPSRGIGGPDRRETSLDRGLCPRRSLRCWARSWPTSVQLLAVAITVTGVAGCRLRSGPPGLPHRGHTAADARPRPLHPGRHPSGSASLLGPFIAAAIVSQSSIGAAYAFDATNILAAAVLTAFLPDVPARPIAPRPPERKRPHRSVVSRCCSSIARFCGRSGSAS